MKLRNKQTYIRTTKEEFTGGKTNISKLIYFAVLILLTCFILFYIFSKYYYVSGSGQVVFDVTYVQPDRDIRIEKFLVKEGTFVKKGDPLIEYETSNYLYNVNTPGDEGRQRYDMDTFRLHRDLEEKKIEKAGLEKELELLQGQLDSINRLQSLEVYMRKDMIPVKKRIDELRLKTDLIENEINLLNKLTGQVHRGVSRQGAGVQSFDYSGKGIIQSPSDGQVTKLYRETYEVVPKGDNIIAVHQVQNPRIKAYFEQNDIQHIASGLRVDIEFPGGTRGCGVIDKYYPYTTLPLPEELQIKSEPVHRSLVADITPCKGDEARWKYFYKMNVKIKVKRWKR